MRRRIRKARSPNSWSPPPPLLAGPRLRAASARWRAPCSAPCSCNRCNRAWSCSASTRRCRISSSASSWCSRRGSMWSTGVGCNDDEEREMSASAVPLVAMHDISLSFGGVHAVDRVSVDLQEGEVMALLGHNGAGKSTLVKILSGAYQREAGTISIRGDEAIIANPRDAKKYGIETIYQTLALADNVDASANLFLGRELRTRWGTLDDIAMEAEARKVMGRLNPHFQRFKEPVRALSGGQRQSGGIGIFLISHDIHDVFDLADRICVMKNGRVVGTARVADVTKDEVLGMIILGKCPPAAIPGPGAIAAEAAASA